MLRLTEFILGLFTLIEAEGRLLRLNALRFTCSACMLIIAFLCAATALAFFLAALYHALILYVSAPFALSLMGVACGILAIILFWSAAKWPMSKKKTVEDSKSQETK